ncbi:MAG: PKD domain-containing protein [bacterium]
MFKIKNLTKYAFFALTLALVVFISIPNNAKAGDEDYSYGGDGWGDNTDYSYSYSEPTYSEPTYSEPTYSEPTYSEPTYSEPTYFEPTYSEPTYSEPTYSSAPTYSEPTYSESTYSQSNNSYSSPSYSSYSYPSYSSYGSSYSSGGSNCSSCSYGSAYRYTPAPQIVYVPNTTHVTPVVNPTPTATLDASCVVNPNNVYVNDSVTLSGSATGGSGSYSYQWSAPDGISGTGQTMSGRFTTAGSKTVYLTVTSGSQSVTRTCNAYVNQVTPPVQNLDASCTISPNNVYLNDTVTISGNATGGTGSYSYFWSGSDGISGSSQVVTGRFTSVGSKVVSLTVTSGTQSITRSCNAYVNQNYNYNNNYNYGYNYNNGYNYNYNSGYNYVNMTATCVATPVNANVGDNVIWTVYPVGGNGSYTYSWSGSDGLSYGNAYQIQQRYTTPGTKTATVTVYSTNGQSIVATCNTNIIGSVSAGKPISGIYLNEVPATGISFNLKIALYILGLILWSAFVGLMVVEKKKAKLALANRARIEDFKQENLKKKGML